MPNWQVSVSSCSRYLTTGLLRRDCQSPVGVKPGLPPWGPHVRFRRVQTLVREGSPLVKLRNSAWPILRIGVGWPCPVRLAILGSN